MRTIVALISLLTIPTLGAGLAGQTAQAPQSSAILVDAVVTDAAGRPVAGLHAPDFDVREDGRPMVVQSLTRVDDADAATQGRTYVIAVDSLHLSTRGALRVRPLVEQFLAEVPGPRDRMAIATLGLTPAVSDLTSDRQRLLEAIGEVSADASDTAARQREHGLSVTPIGLGGISEAGARAFATLTRIVDGATAPRGRRVTVLFISEGIPFGLRDSHQMNDARRAFFAAAALRNASVYPIDPVGMAAISSGLEPSAESEPAGLEGWDSLRLIARNTGGRAILGHVNMTAPFRQIAQDSGAYYVLAYDSPHVREHDGDFHEIRIRVKRSGVTVRARTGWYEPAS